MYPVSNAFLDAVKANNRKYYWTGRITTTAGTVYEFDQDDMVKGSGYITSQCCGSTEIELGTVYAAEMGISLFSEINRYTLEDAKVEFFYHLQVAGGSYERIPMGIFEVSEANRKAKCLEIKAYDYMVRFEKAFTSLESIGNAYDFMVLCSTACDVTLAQDRATIEAMPNGTENLSIYSDNDIETYRDVLFYVGQVLGGFFVINRAGELELRKYGNTPVLTVERKHRFTSSFSDFITRYTAVSSTNLRTQIAEYYALDVGDVLSFSGGQADATKYACITSNSIKIGGRQSIKCVGKNPKLSQAKSKNDKNISGLLAQIEAGKIGIHTFTNASAFSVADVDTKIISIEFATTEANHAQFFGQVIVDVTAQPVTRSVTASGDVVIPSVNVDGVPVDPEDPEEEPVVIGSTEEQTITVSLPMSWQEDGHADVIFSFEFNNQMIPVHYPQENWHSGRHTILLYYPIENVVPNYTNIFNVYMRCEGGTAAVDTGMCIASISGQNMGASAAWDGRIDIEEYVDLFRIGNGRQNGRLQVKYRRVIWQCNAKFKDKKHCSTPHLTEDEIKTAFVRVANKLVTDRTVVLKELREIQRTLTGTDELETEQKQLAEQMNADADAVQELIAQNARVAQDQTEYNLRYDALVSRFDKTKARYEQVAAEIAMKGVRRREFGRFIKSVENLPEMINEFDEALWGSLVEKVTVYSKDKIVFTMTSGMEIEV